MTDLSAGKMTLFAMPNGRVGGIGTNLVPLSLSRYGLTGRTKNNVPTVDQEYSNNRFGQIVVSRTFKTPPSGLDTFNLTVRKAVEESYLDKRGKAQDEFPIWRAFSPCVTRDNPQGWLNGGQLEYFGSNRVTSGGTETDGPVVDGSDPIVTETVPVASKVYLKLLPMTISNLTFTDALNVTDLTGILVINDPVPGGCITAYRGPGKHIMVSQQADTGVPAEVFYSVNGGGSWAAMSSNPFGNDEHIGHIVGGITTGNRMRIAVSRSLTDVGNPAEIAYGDITFGAEGTITFTNVNVGANTGDIITMMAQLFPLRAYYGTDNGTLHVSTDQHESNSEIASGLAQINVAIRGYGECEDVWFGGDTNTLLVERNLSGSVSARVGPSGGGAFTALALSSDGLLFAGNGQSLYVSRNQGENAGGWSEVKDFGAAHVVKNIFLPEGDPYNIYCVVDVTTPGSGEFWHSNDAGNSWNLVSVVTNGGYNGAAASIESPNEYWICGDDDGANGVVHKLLAQSGGCN
jgi:hypothetical protein